MTKKWSSTRSLDGQTKRGASKTTRRYSKEFVKEVLEADASPNEATFDNADDLLEYLNSDVD
jgi:hypothetical protein